MVQYTGVFSQVGVDSTLTGTLKIKVTGWQFSSDHVSFYFEDSITDGFDVETVIHSRTKRIEMAFYDSLFSQMMIANPGLLEEPKFDQEWEKVRLMLLYIIQQDLLPDAIHTIYGFLPSDWEYSI